MRKSFRKGLALLLAAALAFGTPVAVSSPTAKAFEEVEADANGVYTLEGIGWWNEANPMTKDYDFVDGKWEIYMSPITETTDCNVEFWEGLTTDDGGHYLTTGSLRDCWYAAPKGEDLPDAPEIIEASSAGLVMGHIYKITAERDTAEETLTVTYYDTNTEEVFFSLIATDQIFGDTLKAHIMSQFGTIRVAEEKAALESLISDLKVSLSEDGQKILISYTKDMEPDSVEVKVNDELIDSSDEGTLEYTPTESGTYTITVTAKKDGYNDDEETASIGVSIGDDGTIIYDEDLIENLRATKAADAYSITFDKVVEDATYTIAVQGGGKTVAVDANNNVKFTDLTSGTEYTVTVTASKDGYVTKTATTTFTYTEEKVEDAGADVKRTTINKTLGATDYSTAFWTAFDSYKIEDNKKYTFVFENHGTSTNNWNNFVLAFANQADFNNDTRGDSYVEYGIIRADNYGWSMSGTASVPNTTLSGKAMTFTNSITDPAAGSNESWEEWKSIIKDSNVTMAVIRSGSEIKVEATIVSQADASKKIEWTASLNVANTNGSAPNPLYMAFTVDGAYLNLKYVDEQVSTEKLAESGDSTQTPTPTTQTNSMMIKTITVTAGKKKITGTVNASNATVQVKVGSKAYKKATVSGKKFTFTAASKLKIGTKVTVKATATGYTTATKSVTVKGTMKVSSVKAKKGSKSITGKVSVKKTTVKVKVGKKKYKKAKVSGKKFTFSTSALKKGTTVKVKVTRKNYTSVTKSVKVK